MRFPRLTTAVVGAALAVGLTAAPASAAITSGYFACHSNTVSASQPQYEFESTTSTLWWIPQFFSWNGQSWEHAAWGEYVYNTESGAPHAWYSYNSREYVQSQGYPTHPAGYYAVRNWVHAEGSWHSRWAVLSDPDQYDSTYWCHG